MRLLLPLILTLTAAPAGAQAVIQPGGMEQTAGPNVRAAQRPMGPNARAAQRPVGPNGALMERAERAAGQAHYPSCSAAGAVRDVPIRRGEPGYGRHLDPDADGVACEGRESPEKPASY